MRLPRPAMANAAPSTTILTRQLPVDQAVLLQHQVVDICEVLVGGGFVKDDKLRPRCT